MMTPSHSALSSAAGDTQTRAARVVVVMGHGRADGLCHHLLDVCKQELEAQNAEFRVHSLLADGFDPVLRMQPGESFALPCDAAVDPLLHRYQQDVGWADAYVIAHPVWWFSAPAILKGWVDKVLADGIAMQHMDDGPPQPLFTGKRALVVQTFGAARVVDRIVCRGVSWAFWRRAVFFSVGISDVARLALYAVEDIEPDELAGFSKRLRRKIGMLVQDIADARERLMDAASSGER